MSTETFAGFLVERDADGSVSGRVVELREEQLPSGEVTIDVAYSSVNFKDALAAQGHPGVARRLPHVPGVDAAGTVRSSSDPRVAVGQEVIVTGYELGSGQWGGWAERIRVPAAWVVAKPAGLSLREAMILGTAGFTAAQCALALQRCEIQPGNGEVVVTGATGGVGSLAVKLLAQLGYDVVASTGKQQQTEQLLAWGARRVIDRKELVSESIKPLLSSRWAAAVDTVGGATLTTLLRETNPYGCVTACGLVAGADLPLTVHPFLLRGISLVGIASALYPSDKRLAIWNLLAGEWRIEGLEGFATQVTLHQLPEVIDQILQGRIVGRTVVEVGRS